LNKREEKIELKLVNAIPEESLKFYEKSYLKSRFGECSPIDLFSKIKQNPILYKERIFFCESKDEL